jgi:hypothetical protein
VHGDVAREVGERNSLNWENDLRTVHASAWLHLTIEKNAVHGEVLGVPHVVVRELAVLVPGRGPLPRSAKAVTHCLLQELANGIGIRWMLLPVTVQVGEVGDRLLGEASLAEAQKDMVVTERVWEVDHKLADQDDQIYRQAQVLGRSCATEHGPGGSPRFLGRRGHPVVSFCF